MNCNNFLKTTKQIFDFIKDILWIGFFVIKGNKESMDVRDILQFSC